MAWTVTLVNEGNEDTPNDISPLTIKRSSTPKNIPGFDCSSYVADATLDEIEPLNLLFPGATEANLQPNYTAFGDVIGKPEYEIDDIKTNIKLTGVLNRSAMNYVTEDNPNPRFQMSLPNISPFNLSLPQEGSSTSQTTTPFGFLGNALCTDKATTAQRVFQYLKTGGDIPDLQDTSFVEARYPEGNGYAITSGNRYKYNKVVDKDTKFYNVNWPLGWIDIKCRGGESLKFNLGSSSAKVQVKIGNRYSFEHLHNLGNCVSEVSPSSFPFITSVLSIVKSGTTFRLQINVSVIDTAVAGGWTGDMLIKNNISPTYDPPLTLPISVSGTMQFRNDFLLASNPTNPNAYFQEAINVLITQE
jgi:hypothetical protein